MASSHHTAQEPVTKILGDLGAHDIGHVIKFDGGEGVLTRVLHEGGSTGVRPTYLTLQTDGLTSSMTGRFDHDLSVTVMPDPPQRLLLPLVESGNVGAASAVAEKGDDGADDDQGDPDPEQDMH